MAHTESDLSKWSTGESENHNLWSLDTSDAIATVLASGYLNKSTARLRLGDVIFVIASDSKIMIEITSASAAATVTTIEYTVSVGGITLAQGSSLIGNSSGVGVAIDASTDKAFGQGNGTTQTYNVMTGDATMNNTAVLTISAGAIDLAMLSSGITPSHVSKFAGEHTYGGGGTSDARTVTGVLSTDIITFAPKAFTNASYITKVVPTTDTITFTWNTDPGASTAVYYNALRAAS